MCMRQLQSSYLLNELLGEFVFLGFCSHQTLMLSQHNPGTTATLSCLITRHTTLVVGQSRPWRQCWFSCEIHLPEPRLARWLSLLPSAINHSALHPPTCTSGEVGPLPFLPLCFWGMRRATDPTHTCARARAHILMYRVEFLKAFLLEWSEWAAGRDLFCRTMTKILLWSSQLVLVHGQYQCVHAVF